MKTYRRTAIAVGILYILATAMPLLGNALSGGLADAGDRLGTIAAGADRLVGEATLAVLAGLCCVLIAALLFPVLKRVNEGVALGYVGVRIVEAVTLMVTALSLLLLVTLGRESLAAGASAGALPQLASLVEGLHDWAFPLNPLVFGPGAALLYGLLYASRLVPRWLSLWALVGAALVFAYALLRLWGGGTMLLAVPIGVQEMVLAGWLIVRGFDAAALARLADGAGPGALSVPARAPHKLPVLARPETQV